jgi:hypothetical protein
MFEKMKCDLQRVYSRHVTTGMLRSDLCRQIRDVKSLQLSLFE